MVADAPLFLHDTATLNAPAALDALAQQLHPSASPESNIGFGATDRPFPTHLHPRLAAGMAPHCNQPLSCCVHKSSTVSTNTSLYRPPHPLPRLFLTQGRVFALEMALFVTTESVSGFCGGAMFDFLQLGTQRAAAVMAAVATAVAVCLTTIDAQWRGKSHVVCEEVDRMWHRVADVQLADWPWGHSAPSKFTNGKFKPP